MGDTNLEKKKRCLPSWMSGCASNTASSANQSRNFVKKDGKKKVLSETQSVDDTILEKKEFLVVGSSSLVGLETRKPKRKLNRSVDYEEEDDDGLFDGEEDGLKKGRRGGISGVGKRPQPKKKRRQTNKSDDLGDQDDIENWDNDGDGDSGGLIDSEFDSRKMKDRKGRTGGAGKTTQPMKRKKRGIHKSDESRKKRGIHKSDELEDMESSSLSEGDDDLTVEDLISIAQEYVKAEERKEHQVGAVTEPESRKHVRATLPSSRNETEVICCETAQSSGGIQGHTTTGHLKETDSTSEAITVNPSRTGDPAQDMLDLFFGSLLKKAPAPSAEEKKLEAVTKHIDLEYEFRKQRPKEVPQGEVVTKKIDLEYDEFRKQSQKGDASAVIKKKISLKDKVAMLLE